MAERPFSREQSGPAPEMKEKQGWKEGAAYVLGVNYQRACRLFNDPVTREGGLGVLRTVTNGAISLVDVIPVVGDVVSLTADAAKVVKRAGDKIADGMMTTAKYAKWMRFVPFGVGSKLKSSGESLERMSKYFRVPALDLTPDVSLKVALGSELLELCTAGFFPSHIIETLFQLKADWPRMRAGFARAKELWNEEVAEFEKDEELQLAMATFGVKAS